jgi:hypothetical protein
MHTGTVQKFGAWSVKAHGAAEAEVIPPGPHCNDAAGTPPCTADHAPRNSHPPVQIHPPCHDICGHQDSRLEGPEVCHGGHALRLGAVRGQRCCWEAGSGEPLAQPVGSWLAVAKHHRLGQKGHMTGTRTVIGYTR